LPHSDWFINFHINFIVCIFIESLWHCQSWDTAMDFIVSLNVVERLCRMSFNKILLFPWLNCVNGNHWPFCGGLVGKSVLS
jgi:hypothetical protein